MNVVGRLVDRMIRRSVRKAFRGVYWIPPKEPLPRPCVFAPNHHGWFDGYVMRLASIRLRQPIVTWIEEFDAFPLFRSLGGMPFPRDDAMRRAATIRRTIRLLRAKESSLLFFPEGVLHRPPEVLPFGRTLDVLTAKVPGLQVVPVALRYELNVHERPECFLLFGQPLGLDAEVGRHARVSLETLLLELESAVSERRESFELLAAGTRDLNERWDMRRAPWSRVR